jgi:hypothetical protein
MANPATLCLLATLSLFSGCLGQTSVDDHALGTATPADGSTTAPAEVEAGPATGPDSLPKCPDGGRNNYGIAMTVGDDYIWSGVDGKLLVYYHESNGCQGFQSEGEWPHNPDTKVAQAPSPLAFGNGASAAKA